MRKTIWSAGLLCLATLLSLGTVGRAAAPGTNVRQTVQPQDTFQTSDLSGPKLAIQTQLKHLSQLPPFQDWQQAQAAPVRYLYDPSGLKTAILWQVDQTSSSAVKSGGKGIGYLVSTLDGTNVYEFSHRPVPTLPASLLPKRKNQGYIYAGPMLHLVYLQDGNGVKLYDLLTGETLPSGELLNRVPVLKSQSADSMQQPNAAMPTRVQPIPAPAAPADDALYATGLFSLHKSEPQPSVMSLQHFAEGYAFEKPTFVVYDAIPDKFYVSLSITQLLQVGEQYFVGVQDPFAETEAERARPAVYIDSRFPVCAVETSTTSATKSNAK